VTIRSGLFIGSGRTFVLGSEEAPGDNGTISGGVHAAGAANVQLHFVTINGGIDSAAAPAHSVGRSGSRGTRSRTAASTAA
jgi:hypothetical protein